MPNLDDLPANLQAVIRETLRQVDALSAKMEAGDITVDQWRDQMEAIIEAQTESSLEAGAGETVGAADLLERLIQVQLDFLAVFAADIVANHWLPAYRSRAQMYAESVKVSYYNGEIIKQVGRVLPLPAMPAEGTICLTRCGCSWEIETVNAANRDYDAYWRRGKTDSCATCIEREKQWSPVRIRGGELRR